MIIRYKNNIFERVKKNHADLAWNYPAMTLITFFNGNWGISYCLNKLSLSLNSGNMSRSEVSYFQGSVCFSIFWDAANAQQAEGGSHINPFVFFEMFVPAKPPPPKFQNSKLPEPKCRCRDHHCPPGDPHCFHLHLPRSWILLLVQLYPAKRRRFYQGIVALIKIEFKSINQT